MMGYARFEPRPKSEQGTAETLLLGSSGRVTKGLDLVFINKDEQPLVENEKLII